MRLLSVETLLKYYLKSILYFQQICQIIWDLSSIHTSEQFSAPAQVSSRLFQQSHRIKHWILGVSLTIIIMLDCLGQEIMVTQILIHWQQSDGWCVAVKGFPGWRLLTDNAHVAVISDQRLGINWWEFLLQSCFMWFHHNSGWHDQLLQLSVLSNSDRVTPENPDPKLRCFRYNVTMGELLLHGTQSCGREEPGTL